MTLDPNARISRSQAVLRIAERLSLKTRRDKETENSVSHRIGYAVKQGFLQEEAPGQFVQGELARWARQTWPGVFNDWPQIDTVLVVSSAAAGDSADGIPQPATLERAHSTIFDLHRVIEVFTEALKRSEEEKSRLEHDAEHWKVLRKRNQANAKKPRS